MALVAIVAIVALVVLVALVAMVTMFYNGCRLPSSLGYVSPHQSEAEMPEQKKDA